MCQLFLIMYFLYFYYFVVSAGTVLYWIHSYNKATVLYLHLPILCFYILEYFLLLANVALSRSILYYTTVISYSLSIHFSPSCYTYTLFCMLTYFPWKETFCWVRGLYSSFALSNIRMRRISYFSQKCSFTKS